MASNLQMLKQVRAVTSLIAQTTDNAGHKSLLSVADIYLNNLLLQQAPQFYLDLVAQGRALVEEGVSLAAKSGAKLTLPSEPAALHPDSRMEAIDAHIEALFDRMVAIIGLLDESRSAQEKDFLARWSMHLRYCACRTGSPSAIPAPENPFPAQTGSHQEGR